MKRLALFICTLLCANVLLAQTRFWVDSLQYEVTSTSPAEVEVHNANGSITTANIPATVSYEGTTYSVTSIGYGAFEGCSSLTSVTIPNSVTSIGGAVFYGCSSLTSVTIPNSVTSIGDQAFQSCSSLTSVTIPNSVTSIGSYAFKNCSSLTSVTIPNSVTSIGNWAFDDCSSLTSVTLPNNATISSDAFSGAGGSSITIDSVVYKAGNTLTVGNYTLTNTGFLTFYLEGIAYSHTEAIVYDCNTNKSGDLIIPSTINVNGNNLNVTSIGDDAFKNCSSLTSVTIPNSVTSIGYSAFYNCSSLTSVTIPNSVTEIGNYAFKNCSSLTSITIPNASIGYYVFAGCSSLTSVTIGNSVTSIGDGAFQDCSSLTSITIPNSVTSIGDTAFNACSSLTTLNFNAVNCEDFSSYSSEHPFKNCPITTINIGDSVERIPAYFACNLDSLTSVTIGNSVTSIGDHAFNHCSSLTSITIPNSVTSIGSSAFSNCSSLTSITIPNSVTSIGEEAFKNCSSLTSVTIPNSSIGNNAFDSCSALTSVSLDMSSIPANLFPQSTALQNLTFGENVTSIASGAFSPYSFLQNVTCLATTSPTLADNTVFPYPNIATLTVPCGTLEAYSAPTSFWNMFFAGRIEEDCSGIEQAEAESISFFPNPTKSEITFSQTIEKVEVIDLTGKTILTFTNAKTINIESLPAGAYYLRLTNNDKTIIRKAIKQ